MCATNVDVKYVKASEFAACMKTSAKNKQEEITDEELLQMALVFEKKHLESVSNVKK